jgi:predicted membrane-bound spermidine synthase/tetratricopeptide (TPR) repeat protein
MRATFQDRARAAAVAIFFFSGASGLIYQVVWVRQLARVFGNTVHSAALVTAVFMAGLGAGSFLIGRWSDRRYRTDPRHPLRVYAYAELAIGALGTLLSLVLPRLGPLSALFFTYQRGADGFFEVGPAALAMRYAIAVVVVAPATFLMGGTLPLLIRFVVGSELGATGRRIGVLYGLNTAGAALGALLTDFVLVPRLGISGTQLLAVALNVAAGFAALALARSAARVPAPPIPATSVEPAGHDLSAGRAVAGLTGATMLLAGFAAMGFEIVWFRYLTQLLGGLRGVLSLLLAVILVGIWLGSMLGGWAHHRLGSPDLLFILSQSLFVLTAFAQLGLLDHAALADAHVAELRDAFRAASPMTQRAMELWSNLRSIALVVLLPAILMGASFPLANAVAQRAASTLAGRAGLLYFANTAGNVLGSVLAGFVLLPALGIQQSAFVLLAVAAVGVIPIAISSWPKDLASTTRAHVVTLVGSAAMLTVALAGFSLLPPNRLLRPAVPSGTGAPPTIVSVSEGVNETILIGEVPGFRTSLYTNGHSMASDSPRGQRYMHAFAHLPLLAMEHPERVLVICFGTGNTLYAASLHPVARLEVADLSRHVLDHAHYFAASNHDVLRDPRVAAFVNDGRHHLLMQPAGSYDLITLEPPPISYAGVSGLYSREFYALAKDRLKAGGYLTQWLPAYQLGGDAVLAMVRAFIEVFPQSVLLSGDDNELILMGTTGPSVALDPAALLRRLHERPQVAVDLARLDMGTLTEIAGAFVASYETMAAVTARVPPVTDDRPSMEYVLASRLGTLALADMPRELFDPSNIDAYCPGCLRSVPGLADYLRVRARLYAADSFLSNGRHGEALYFEDLRATIAGSVYLTRLFEGEAFGARRAGAAHLARGELPEAIGAYEYAISVSGPEVEALEGLGLAYLEDGQFEQAAAMLSAALRIDPDRASAHFGLARAVGPLGDADQAIAELRRGLDLEPQDAEAHYDLGVLLYSTGAKAAGEQELEETLALDPLHPRANLVRCRRAAAAGDLARASEHCDLAARYGAAVPEELAAKLRRARSAP